MGVDFLYVWNCVFLDFFCVVVFGFFFGGVLVFFFVKVFCSFFFGMGFFDFWV